MSQCISLRDSQQCSAFNASSISTTNDVVGQFPFLAFVSDVDSFDNQLVQYVQTTYTQNKYQQLLGCSNLNLTDTTQLYARYTTSFICNSIIQLSRSACGLSGDDALSLCADDCASFAISEETIASTPALCGTTSSEALGQIRADFTRCSLPDNALAASCVRAYTNEPENCGFHNNLPSLCSYCAASSPNATDSCCLFSNTTSRCEGVTLPITTSMGSLSLTLTSATQSPTATSATNSSNALSGGAIAGIVIGSILGAIALLALIIGICLCMRRRKQESRGNIILNTPSPTRGGTVPMSFASPTRAGEMELPHGARVHHMAALEGSQAGDGSPSRDYMGSGSSGYENTPESQRSLGAPKRGGSRMGVMGAGMDEFGSSPEGMASGQSEQMSSFKDYYSNDDMHPGDMVATLWAYQPRAGDEWELERGDMLKIVGIWDDGWATGYKIKDRAEDWETTQSRRNDNRDSGLSNISASKTSPPPGTGTSGPPDGEIKAFPLVCVCLPQHWRKTIEGDTSALDPNLGGSPGTP